MGDIQREVIARRFGLLGHEKSTLEEVSKAVNVSREKVRQLQNFGLRKLRNIIHDCGISREIVEH